MDADGSSNESDSEVNHATLTLDAWDDWFMDPASPHSVDDNIHSGSQSDSDYSL